MLVLVFVELGTNVWPWLFAVRVRIGYVVDGVHRIERISRFVNHRNVCKDCISKNMFWEDLSHQQLVPERQKERERE